MSQDSGDIISAILQSALTGVSKMRIMYNCYLSYGQVKEYLAFLQKNDLITFDWKTRHYTTTAKGKNYLYSREKIDELVSLKDKSSQKNPTDNVWHQNLLN